MATSRISVAARLLSRGLLLTGDMRYSSGQLRDPHTGEWIDMGYSLERLRDIYGEIVHEVDIGDPEDGPRLTLFDNGDMAMTFAAEGETGNRVVKFDGFDADMASDIADLVDRMRDNAEEYIDNEEDAEVLGEGGSVDRLVDWDETDGGYFAGYDSSGDIRVGVADDPDEDPDESGTKPRIWDMSPDEAEELASGLRELADFEAEEVESVSIGDHDLSLYSDHQIWFTDDGGETSDLTLNRSGAVTLRDALAQVRDGHSEPFTAGYRYVVEPGSNGNVRITDRLVSPKQTVEVQRDAVGRTVDALTDMIGQIRPED